MLSGWGTLAGAGALILAAILGKSAVKDFKSQKVLERQIDQAEKALTVAYRLQDAISYLRNPAIFGNELADSREELKDLDWFQRKAEASQDKFVTSNVYYQRMRSQKAVFESAFEILPFVRAHFGKEIFEAFREILKQGRSVTVYANAFANDTGTNPTHTRKIESVLWEGGDIDGKDPLGEKVDESLSLIERELLPKIQLEPRPTARWKIWS